MNQHILLIYIGYQTNVTKFTLLDVMRSVSTRSGVMRSDITRSDVTRCDITRSDVIQCDITRC